MLEVEDKTYEKSDKKTDKKRKASSDKKGFNKN